MEQSDRDERVQAHIDALDEQLARLRALDAALGARQQRSEAELRELSRALQESSDELRARFRPPPADED